MQDAVESLPAEPKRSIFAREFYRNSNSADILTATFSTNRKSSAVSNDPISGVVFVTMVIGDTVVQSRVLKKRTFFSFWNNASLVAMDFFVMLASLENLWDPLWIGISVCPMPILLLFS